ncbi:MAG: putative hydroxymethylpyrimidine transporter CytX, partial [Clostridia bacterium]|nr:putative hydroxymethylpyrimidine transporter CytX [Clostridia bacterium]
MKEKRTSVFENGLIWFGAAVSIAEILTGTYFAPLGFAKGLLAIVIGHIIGCAMLFLAGLIGGKVRKSSMETAKMSFGKKGALLFSVLNIIQLIGWTAIMIYDGAIAVNGIFDIGNWVWCIVIGGLIVLWILIGIKNLGKVNTVAMAALFILTVVLSFVIFKKGAIKSIAGEGMTFGAAVELSVAMPLSWLPLISDYTREAEKPVKATAVSAAIYGIISCWMYVIGMGAAIFTGESDIAMIMVKAGLGIAGLLIIIFSTVTTTFLDAYSAGISSESLSKKINGKWVAVIVTAVGTVGAIFLPLTDITDFLYFIGSVFAPMIATMKVNADNMRNAAAKGFINATDCADYLVTKGLPFRSAYKVTGELVAYCIREEKTLETLSLAEYKEFHELFDEEVYQAIDMKNCVYKRISQGGTSPEE